MESCLLRVVRGVTDVTVIVRGSFFLLARREHALQGDADGGHAEDWRPLIAKNGCTNMSIGINMRVYRRLLPVCDDELDSGRGYRVLAVKPELQHVLLPLVERLSHDLDGEQPGRKVIGLEELNANWASFVVDLSKLFGKSPRRDRGHSFAGDQAV